MNISLNCILRLSIIKCHILINILKIQPDTASSAGALKIYTHPAKLLKLPPIWTRPLDCAPVFPSHARAFPCLCGVCEEFFFQCIFKPLVTREPEKALREVRHGVNSTNHNSPMPKHSHRPKTDTLYAKILPDTTHTRPRLSLRPSLPWRDVAALLHEGSQGEPEGVKDAELVGGLVSGAQLGGALLWLLSVPLVRAEATHLRQKRQKKSEQRRSFKGPICTIQLIRHQEKLISQCSELAVSKSDVTAPSDCVVVLLLVNWSGEQSS